TRRCSARKETCWPLPGFGSRAIAIPAAAVPAKWRSCVPSVPAPAESRPESYALPAPSWPGPPAWGAHNRPCHRSSASARNGLHGRNRANRTAPSVRSLPAARPSLWRSSLPRQLHIVDLAGGVVQDHDQVVPTLILKPPVFAAVDVQHHPRQRTPLTPLAVHPAPGLALHQAGCLQGLLHPRVAQPDLMFFAELLMKVTHVQIEVPVPVEAQNLFGLRLRHSPATWLPPSPVQQALVALLLIALPPSSHLPLADADQLRCLPPLDLPRCGS